jgi:hypothetical protein
MRLESLGEGIAREEKGLLGKTCFDPLLEDHSSGSATGRKCAALCTGVLRREVKRGEATARAYGIFRLTTTGPGRDALRRLWLLAA